jgi:hypothetical protein
MDIFLLIISIIFNLVNLFFILVLWKKYSLSDLSALEKTKNEIEDLLISYTIEMKDDNEKLLSLLGNQIHKNDQVDNVLNQQFEEKNDNMVDEDNSKDKQAIQSDEITYAELINDTDQEVVVKSVKEEAIMLSKEGLSLEEIAKKLGKGKGEIELLLKFHKE